MSKDRKQLQTLKVHRQFSPQHKKALDGVRALVESILSENFEQRLVELTQPDIAETDFIAVILQFDWRAAVYWLLRMTYPFGGAGNFTVILHDHAVMKHCDKTWA